MTADSESFLASYAELIARLGANVQAGQLVFVNCGVDHVALARAVANAAYAAGARYVDVSYFDRWTRRPLIERGAEDDVRWTPPWLVARMRALGDEEGAAITIVGQSAAPFQGLDPRRVGLARFADLAAENFRLVSERRVSWTIAPCATPEWAEAVYGSPDVEPLWRVLRTALRLDGADPLGEWTARMRELERRAETLNRAGLGHIRFRGDGTDLLVRLLPDSIWRTAVTETSSGIRHVPNLPTEEVFTTPDPTGTEGVVAVTRPVVIHGTTVRDLVLSFAGGRVVDVRAAEGADAVRAHLELDDGASRLGEVALVDGASPVADAEVTFFEPLLDENVTSHIALGRGWDDAVRPSAVEAVNQSHVHTDLMIGGPAVDADGIAPDRSEVPLLRGAAWALD